MLDYMEGNLSDDLTIELMAFANNHPELEIDIFDNVADLSFVADDISYGDKSDLKVHDEEALFDKMVGIVEGEYSASEVAEIEKEISAKELDKTYAYFKATKLVPNKAEVYGNTSNLKVETGRVISMRVWRYSSIAAAAVITIIALAYNFTGGVDSVGNKTINGLAKEEIKLLPKNTEFNHSRGTIDEGIQEFDDQTYVPNNNLVAFKEENNFIPEDTAQNNLPNLIPDIDNNIVKIEPEEDTTFIAPDPIEDDNNIAYNEPGSTTKSTEPFALFTNAMSDFINTDVAYVKEETSGGPANTVTHKFSLGKFSFERKKSN